MLAGCWISKTSNSTACSGYPWLSGHTARFTARSDIIQALERIGDAAAVPTLRSVAKNDGFQVVRAYAAKAVERLS